MFKKIAFSFFILIYITQIFSITVETSSFNDFLYWHTDDCEYDNWISHISEGIAEEGYNIYSPWDVQTTGFGDYYLPEQEELDNWQTVVETFLAEDYEEAQTLIDGYGFPYEVVEFNDTVTGRTYYLLRENLDMSYYDANGTAAVYDDEEGSFDYGWGLYIYNPQSSMPIVVTAPHPNDDFPTPAVSYQCFVDWDAMFLLISGAGREVKWTEQGNYSNSKSLSDPSRNDDHAFTVAYKLFCDKIRDDFGRREFSPQIHSYDWNRHSGYPSCQISAGYNKGCPNLPIRDLSELKIDIINASSHIMVPANTIGSHPDVYLNDYYSVNYDLYEFIFVPESGSSYPVNNSVDLEGYSQNRQMLYSFYNWNRYDVFEPFFHMEMDELPNCYDETEDNYKWFYAYNSQSGMYDMSQLFAYTFEYYYPWIDAMTEVLPYVIELDDDLIPETPENFSISDVSYDSITLEWENISSFDFKTFEILFADEPIAQTNYEIIDRYDKSILASQLATTIGVSALELNTQYYFKIRARDYNENISLLSEEISVTTSPTIISGFFAIGQNSSSRLEWTAEEQNGNQGFNVYRKRYDEDYIMIDSWETNPLLAGSTLPFVNYIYNDHTVVNGGYYEYMLSSVNEQYTEYFYEETTSCYPEAIFKLYISNLESSIMDSVAFSKNPYASDNFDEYYDVEKEQGNPLEYIYADFYESSWGQNGMSLALETHGNYDQFSYYKSWILRISTNQLNDTIRIFVSPDYYSFYGKLYIRDLVSGEYTNLTNFDKYYTALNTDYKSFRLYWGNLVPYIIFASQENRIYEAGDELYFEWNIGNRQLIEYFSISIQNDVDSVMVADSLDHNTLNYSWIVPDNITIHDANICIDMLTIDGEIIRNSSPYGLGIVPSEITIENGSGWQMPANPWNSDENFCVEEVFGEDAELYLPFEHYTFISVDQFEFGKGYWLYAPEAYSFSHQSSIQKTMIELPMHTEWNLMVNPHLCSYEPKDLKFRKDDHIYSHHYMVGHDFVPDAVYVYRDGSYKITETIEPKESFYIYANIDPVTDLKCQFTPYYHGYGFSHDTAWQIRITASQFDSDDLTAGVSESAGDSFDFDYDLPEPVPKPFEDGVALYFPKDIQVDTLFIYDRLNYEYKSILSGTEPETKTWNFELVINQPASVTLTFDLDEMPEGYHASIILDGNSWNELVSGNYIYSFVPGTIGTLEGEIIITNDILTSAENTLSNKINLSNYPNPFNPETFICYSVPEEGKVELTIYNIKGQRVKKLIRENKKPGYYKIIWNGTDDNNRQVASGVYLYKFSTGKKTINKKMLLLK